MGWVGEGEGKRYIPEYRIVDQDGGFEPQMQYQIGGIDRWYSLLSGGIMADPDAWKRWSGGESYVRVIFPCREMAERAILRAKTINGQNALGKVE